jgi:hypothetical protein
VSDDFSVLTADKVGMSLSKYIKEKLVWVRGCIPNMTAIMHHHSQIGTTWLVIP